MADDEAEVEEFVDIASTLLVNIGTLNKDIKTSITKACKRAKEKGVPVILDPVGVGASKFRKDFINWLFIFLCDRIATLLIYFKALL